METFYIPCEHDIKNWIKEAVKEALNDRQTFTPTVSNDSTHLASRREIAAMFRISLVTLTDWMKRGLPFHKQRGRVYFIRSEVIEYIKTKKIGAYKFNSRYSTIE